MYDPKGIRGVSVMTNMHEDSCNAGDHFWRPITDPSQPANDWKWTCANCDKVMDRRPAAVTPFISKKELEEMVDSSCRVADTVVEDDQSVYGELWLMRSALWVYHPFKVHCIYHIFQGAPFIMLFRYTLYDKEDWQPLNDTKSYRNLLTEADRRRANHNPKVTI